MSWVCGKCSTNNDDEDDVCFVCGESRAAAYTPEIEDESDTASYIEHAEPRSSEGATHGLTLGSLPSYADVMSRIGGHGASPAASPPRSRARFSAKQIVRAKATFFVLILVSLFMGLFIQFYLYKTTGDMFLLSRFLIVGGYPHASVELLSGLFSGLAVIVGVGLGWIVYLNLDENTLIGFCIIVVFYCAATIITPVFSAPFAFVLSLLLLLGKLEKLWGGIRIALFVITMCFCSVGLPVTWAVLGAQYTVVFDMQGGNCDNAEIVLLPGDDMPKLDIPVKYGYTFVGFYDMEQGGVLYYDAEMNSVREWDKEKGATLYARWTANSYEIELKKQGGAGGASRVVVTFDSAMPVTSRPSRSGYVFEGYFDAPEGGTQYYDSNMRSVRNWDKDDASVLYAQWSFAAYG